MSVVHRTPELIFYLKKRFKLTFSMAQLFVLRVKSVLWDWNHLLSLYSNLSFGICFLTSLQTSQNITSSILILLWLYSYHFDFNVHWKKILCCLKFLSMISFFFYLTSILKNKFSISYFLSYINSLLPQIEISLLYIIYSVEHFLGTDSCSFLTKKVVTSKNVERHYDFISLVTGAIRFRLL